MTSEVMPHVVMVTGAAGNVGRGVVQAFHAAGARVALIDREADRMGEFIHELGGGQYLKGFPADINDPAAVDRLVDQIKGHLGPVTALVHTVGGYAAGDPVHEASLDVFDQMMHLNARLVYTMGGRVARHMIRESIPGSITIILARSGKKGIRNHAAYAASKAAATRIMESMAAELREHKIRVNGISPSIVDTPANRAAMPTARFEEWVAPLQIGQLAVYLASEAGSAITGADIEISGLV